MILAILAAFFLISSSNKKAKRPPAKRPFPPIRKQSSTAPTNKRTTYDYMMHSPKNKNTDVTVNEQAQQTIEAKPQADIPVSRPETIIYPDVITSRPDRTISQPAVSSNYDYSSTAIGNMPLHKQHKNIDINKQAMLKAITYTAILNQPRSLKYLERYGIRRLPLK